MPLWTEQRPQPAGEGAVPERLWEALKQHMHQNEFTAFETDREASKAQLARRLNTLEAMPLATEADRLAAWDAKWALENWCQQQEIGAFLRWASRTKFNWRAWQTKRAAYVRGEGSAP